MELKEIQTLAISPAISTPFAASWSEDDKISIITEKGLYIVGGAGKERNEESKHCYFNLTAGKGNTMWLLLLLVFVPLVAGGNITSSVFGSVTDVMPAAYGDFNSDELTDLFVVRENPNRLEVMLAREQEPLLQSDKDLSCPFNKSITGVVPGNFDGDAHMDVMVTTFEGGVTNIFILWGGLTYLNCTSTAIYKMKHQPLVLDYNHDMIVDLFGEEHIDGNRTFLIFNANRTVDPVQRPMMSEKNEPLREPHSHAFLDLDGDFAPDLLLSITTGFELWLNDKKKGFVHNNTIPFPAGLTEKHVGQSLFLDLELTGQIYHLLPVCFDGFKDCSPCKNSTIYAYVKGIWHDLHPDWKDGSGQIWGLYKCSKNVYVNAVTLRGGDFNMDGYPDLLVTLSTKDSHSQAFLLDNVENPTTRVLSRTYKIDVNALAPMNNETVMAAFYDLYQDGILDVILYGESKVKAFRNTLDYDANFVKVMVLTGTDRGGNLPGPSISYNTTTQEGNRRAAVTAQLPQSAHFSLGLPYTIFGLGRTPNFVDTLTVGVAGESKEWTQIIPNSQMVVIPSPLTQSNKWRAQLFITPSKMILLSVVALAGTCILISAIIGALYWKERREDRIEKLQEAHRFHFDAM